jgi:putative flippase GtrA
MQAVPTLLRIKAILRRPLMAFLSRLFDRWIAAWQVRAIGLKAASFAIIGLVNSAVDLGVFSFAYYYLEFTIVPANAVAWAVAVTGSYVMNSMTTFARESGRELHLKAYVGFATSQAAGFVANTAVVFVASYFMPILMGKVLAIGASFLVNFSLSHFVVFRKPLHVGSREPKKVKPVLAFAAAIAVLILVAMATSILTHRNVNSPATDLSSRSRGAPLK